MEVDAAGIDNMSVESVGTYLKEHWLKIKEQLVKGKYKPKPVKRVEIPKPDGGIRKLGIPTVLDRLIQQGIYQILSPIFEPTFSRSSFGFRSGKSARQAIIQAKEYQTGGRKWVVDMDLDRELEKRGPLRTPLRCPACRESFFKDRFSMSRRPDKPE
jgi:retron-type reverse transcriptase